DAVLRQLDVPAEPEAAAPPARPLGARAELEAPHLDREDVLQRLRRLDPAVRERVLDARPAVLLGHRAPAALRIEDRHPGVALRRPAAVSALGALAAQRVDVARSEFAGGDLTGDARRERA